MKKIVLGLVALAFIATEINAQEKKEVQKKGEMKMFVLKNEDGKNTSFDTTFTLNSMDEVQAVLKEKGIEFKINMEGHDSLMNQSDYKFIVKQEVKGSETAHPQELKVNIEALGKELEEIEKVMQLKLKDGAFYEFKMDSTFSALHGGKMIQFDSLHTVKDRAEIEALLRKRGIEMKTAMENGEFLVKKMPNQEFLVKEVIEDEDGEGGFKKFITIHSTDSTQNQEFEVIMKTLDKEMTDVESQIQILKSEQGEFEFKLQERMMEEEIQKLKEELAENQGNVMVKTIVLENSEDGEVTSKVFSVKSDVMVFFVSEEGKEKVDDDLPTEIVENDLRALQLKELKLFPNPNNGHFNINFDSQEENDFQISVSDVNGRIVYEKTLTNFKGKFNEDFDLSQQESGMYFFNIVSGEHRETKKIILK